jgi:hypothetical protein
MAINPASLVFVIGSLMPHPGVPTVPDAALSLGGISLGDTESAVIAELGRPTSRRGTGDFLNVELVFPGLTVWLGEGGRVGEILSTGPEHCTPQGVCPGQPFELVEALYGTPLVAVREDGRYMEYYPQSDFPCWLQIAVESGTVRSIRSECQP